MTVAWTVALVSLALITCFNNCLDFGIQSREMQMISDRLYKSFLATMSEDVVIPVDCRFMDRLLPSILKSKAILIESDLHLHPKNAEVELRC